MLYLGAEGLGSWCAVEIPQLKIVPIVSLFQKANLPIFIYSGISYYTSPS